VQKLPTSVQVGPKKKKKTNENCQNKIDTFLQTFRSVKLFTRDSLELWLKVNHQTLFVQRLR
jgi:hypothetical protein